MSASNLDLIAGVDMTSLTAITGAQLSQLVNAGTPYSDKGLIVTTSDVGGVPDVPNATTTTKWQRYIWLRIGAASTTPYIWNPNVASDATLLKWQTIAQSSIGPGVIVNSMIADNTIQDAKIVGLSYSKISGAPTGLPPSGAAGGDLTGTYPNPTINNLAVTTAKINDLAVTAAKVETCSSATTGIDYTKLRGDGVAKDMLRAKADNTVEWFTPPVIFTSGVVVPTANGLKVPQVNSGATDFQMVAPTTLGRVLQQSYTQTILPATAGSVHCALTATPAQTTGPTSTVLANLTAPAFTPINAGSTVLIEVTLQFASTVGGTQCIGALFQDAIDAAVAAAAVQTNGAQQLACLTFRYSLASWGTGSSKVFKVGISSVANNAVLNSTDGLTTIFGGLGTPSWIKITEYL